MPFRDTRSHLEDMLDSSEAIQDFLVDVTFPQYVADRKIKSAVERELQIVTEAAFRLGELAMVLCPTVDWRRVRGLGNFLRHEYDEIEDEVIWNAIHNQLPLLQAAVRDALTKLEDPDGTPA